MATLVKTGIGDGQTLTPVHITELYDAFTGTKLFDNIIINNTMKVTHDGKVAIGTTVLDTPYQFNVQGTLMIILSNNLVPVKASYSSVIITGVRVCPSPIPVFTKVAIILLLCSFLL
jgi:hypothetical protein